MVTLYFSPLLENSKLLEVTQMIFYHLLKAARKEITENQQS